MALQGVGKPFGLQTRRLLSTIPICLYYILYNQRTNLVNRTMVAVIKFDDDNSNIRERLTFGQ